MGYDENSNQELKEDEEQTSVIKESSMPKLKRKLKKLGEVVLFSFIGAIIFGVTARFFFIKSEGPINKLLGIESAKDENSGKSEPSGIKLQLDNNNGQNSGNNDDNSGKNNLVTLAVNQNDQDEKTPDNGNNQDSNQNTGIPQATQEVDTPSPAPSEGASTDDSATAGTDAQNGPAVADLTPSPITETSKAPEKDKADKGNIGDKSGDTFSQYMDVLDELQKVVMSTEKALVTVKARTYTDTWIGDGVESFTESFGAIIGDDGNDYLIVSSYDRVKAAEGLTVKFCTDSEYAATLRERDSSFNIAILAVPMASVSKDDAREIRELVNGMFGNSSEIYAGMPIIAMGRPNGSQSVEYGRVTSCNNDVYVIDGEMEMFTTDTTNTEKSEGLIIDYSGKVVGIISRFIDSEAKDFASTSIEINSILDLVLDLCNGVERPYVGIRPESVSPEVLEGKNLECGIGVKEVISFSPADIAGIVKGDIIVAVDGGSVRNVTEFMQKVIGVDDEDGIEVTLYRDRGGMTESQELTVLLIPRGH